MGAFASPVSRLIAHREDFFSVAITLLLTLDAHSFETLHFRLFRHLPYIHFLFIPIRSQANY